MLSRHDQLMKALRTLMSQFPEFVEILDYIIQLVEEDKNAKIQEELKNLEQDKWESSDEDYF